MFVALRRGKRFVGAVPSASAVGGDNAKMIYRARAQTADDRTNILVRVPTLALGGSCGPVAGRCTVLEIHGCGQSVRINRTV